VGDAWGEGQAAAQRVLHGRSRPAGLGRCLSPTSAETLQPGRCPHRRGEGSVPWARAGRAACGCSVTPWDAQAGGHGALRLHEPTTPQHPDCGCFPPRRPRHPRESAAAFLGRRGHVLPGGLAASPRSLPRLGPGPPSSQLKLARLITGKSRTSEDLHSSRAAPGKQLSPSASS